MVELSRRTLMRGAGAGIVVASAASELEQNTDRDRMLVVAPGDRVDVSVERFERIRLQGDGRIRLSGDPVRLRAPWYREFLTREFEVDTDGLRTAVEHWRRGQLSAAKLRDVVDWWRSGQPVVEKTTTEENND